MDFLQEENIVDTVIKVPVFYSFKVTKNVFYRTPTDKRFSFRSQNLSTFFKKENLQ